jgi:hypothetical protein
MHETVPIEFVSLLRRSDYVKAAPQFERDGKTTKARECCAKAGLVYLINLFSEKPYASQEYIIPKFDKFIEDFY